MVTASCAEQGFLRAAERYAVEIGLTALNGDVADLGPAMEKARIGGNAEAALQVDGDLDGSVGKMPVQRLVAGGQIRRRHGLAVDIDPWRVSDAWRVAEMRDRGARVGSDGDRSARHCDWDADRKKGSEQSRAAPQMHCERLAQPRRPRQDSRTAAKERPARTDLLGE